MKTLRFATWSLALGLLLATGFATAAERVNVNTADAAALDAALVNVGRSKAEAIVAYRKEHGAFKSAEQLALVKGIGLATVEKNREHIAIGHSTAATKPASRKAPKQAK